MPTMRALAPVIALAACAAAALPARAETLKVDYGISLSGLPLGTAELSANLEGSRYRMELGARLTGLAGALTGGRGGATAAGAVAWPQPAPTSFALTSRTSRDQRTVRMNLSGGNVASLDIAPPLDDKPDRVPLSDSHKRGVTDPVSALLMPIRAAATDPANCNRTIPVFDGGARFDVVLSYVETREIEKPGYKGPVLVCNARYVPIAGHRALRPSTKFMEENRDLQVWLAPVQGTRILVPLRIAIRTMIGMSVIEASSYALQPEIRIVPAAKAGVAQ
jgi:hypothetical protein